MSLDFNFTDGELKELDASELETLLKAYEDIDAADILFGTDRDPPVRQSPIYDSTGYVQQEVVVEDFPQSDIAAANPDASQRKDASVLLITIPEEMQVDPAFDSIASINLERKVLNKIADASAGHDGVYLPISRIPVSDEMVVRRPPLRVIHHVTNSIKVEAAEIPPRGESGKRKQRFHLTRDDRIEFSTSQLSRLRPKESMRKPFYGHCFKWASSDGEETEDAVEDANEPNRCHSCKRVFKKLDQHKCKKIIPIENLTLEEPEVDANLLMLCITCHKSFKSKKGLVAHMKKCSAKKAAGAGNTEVSAQKRSLRSGVKK